MTLVPHPYESRRLLLKGVSAGGLFYVDCCKWRLHHCALISQCRRKKFSKPQKKFPMPLESSISSLEMCISRLEMYIFRLEMYISRLEIEFSPYFGNFFSGFPII